MPLVAKGENQSWHGCSYQNAIKHYQYKGFLFYVTTRWFKEKCLPENYYSAVSLTVYFLEEKAKCTLNPFKI